MESVTIELMRKATIKTKLIDALSDQAFNHLRSIQSMDDSFEELSKLRGLRAFEPVKRKSI